MSAEKRAVAKARFLRGESLSAIAASLGTSTRTLERWSSADKPTWGELREQAQAQATPVLAVLPPVSKRPTPPPPAEPLPTRRIRQGVENELEVLDEAIGNLSADLATDALGKGAMATAMVRLYERREKLQPQTLEQLLSVIAGYLDRNQMGLPDLAVALRDRMSRPPAE
jgi:transposase-like protein